jgi:6-phosphogluconate dehydrogenase
LNELKKAGIIKGNIDGPSVCYCIDEKAWKRTQKMLGDFFVSYKGADCC